MKVLPALLVMLAIFLFSAGSAVEMPQRLLGFLVNKGGHMAGYGLLALAFWRMFEFKDERLRLAWLLAVLYGLGDELHQSFVPGRHPSLVDALVFDNLGAWLALWLAAFLLKAKQPPPGEVVADETVAQAER